MKNIIEIKNLSKKFVDGTQALTGVNLDIHDGEIIYEVNKIRCLALLWCEDEPREKVSEFWCILQDADQASIAAYDKDF